MYYTYITAYCTISNNHYYFSEVVSSLIEGKSKNSTSFTSEVSVNNATKYFTFGMEIVKNPRVSSIEQVHPRRYTSYFGLVNV